MATKEKKRWNKYIAKIVKHYNKRVNSGTTKTEELKILRDIMDKYGFTDSAFEYVNAALRKVQSTNVAETYSYIYALPFDVPKKLTATYQSADVLKVLGNVTRPLRKKINKVNSVDVDNLTVAAFLSLFCFGTKSKAITKKEVNNVIKGLAKKGLVEGSQIIDSKAIKKDAVDAIEKLNLALEAELADQVREQLNKSLQDRTHRIAIHEARLSEQRQNIEAIKEKTSYIRWDLSPAHEVYDICDELQGIIYPADKVPFDGVAHPRCACRMTAVDYEGLVV